MISLRKILSAPKKWMHYSAFTHNVVIIIVFSTSIKPSLNKIYTGFTQALPSPYNTLAFFVIYLFFISLLFLYFFGSGKRGAYINRFDIVTMTNRFGNRRGGFALITHKPLHVSGMSHRH